MDSPTATSKTTSAHAKTTLAQAKTTLAHALGAFAALGLAASTVAVAAQQVPNAAQHAAAKVAPHAALHASARDTPDDASPLAEMAPQLQRWIEESAASTWTIRLPAGADAAAADGADGDAGLRVEVKVGRLNRGMRLAPCARIEPFLPPNARLWGRSFVGVRCAEGASWATMIPVTVSVFGPALIANLPMPAGSMPRPDDFRIDEVDWTRTTGLPVTDPAWLAGRSLARPLSAGQVLRANDLRVPQTIAAGDPVRIRMVGTGFSVSASGFALGGAGEGQSLRVRTETGRMLVGTVRERTVEIRL